MIARERKSERTASRLSTLYHKWTALFGYSTEAPHCRSTARNNEQQPPLSFTMFLTVFRTVEGSGSLLRAACILEVMAIATMGFLSGQLDKHAPPGVQAPDIRFGYSYYELNSFYEDVGEAGRRAYMHCCIFDFVPYMFAYSILLGALLVKGAKRVGVTQNISLIAVSTHMFDFVETAVQARGCVIYPERMTPNMVLIGSIANQAKWLTLIFSVGLLALLFLMPRKEQTNKTD